MAARFSSTKGGSGSPFPINLNDRWRVIEDECQWILQYRRGRPGAKSSGWHSRKFIRRRDCLIACVYRNCGAVDSTAVALLGTLPEIHS